jgi:predicted DNA-binding transcriptional regulator YafY
MGKEFGTKVRLLKVLLAILEQPYRYTKKQLASLFGVDDSVIKADLTAFKDAGFVLEFDEKYRYVFKEEKAMKQLKDLLHFSEEDQLILDQAIDLVGKNQTKKADQLKKKLASLYDYRRLGYAYLRKPYLNKLDLLEEAKNDKKALILKEYRSSNSNIVNDRKVEAFHYNAAEDIIHAFDLEKKELRHFRISRIQRIQILEEKWQFEGHHQIIATDPFRIVDNNQVFVHLRMRVGAYNELLERFPLTEAYIQHDSEEDVFDFQCRVNSRFYGLSNFILGFHHQLVEIVAPESLLEHLRKEIVKMENKWGVD